MLVLALVGQCALAPATLRAQQQQQGAPSQSSQTPQTSQATQVAASPDLAARLDAIEKRLEEKRKELGVPGVSFVIVKDDKVIYARGLGYKDFERKVPVTPDTLFAIGSSSKAFTSMLVAMAADEGKLSLDDSPKKFLPYFRLRDPEADAKITVRDLLDHSSGLNRTDLAWISGKLNREEVIRVAGLAKPTAKLREKFQYQNVMYAAAGEVAARVNNTTWERLVTERLLKPLGMRATTLNVADTKRAPDYAFGYDYDEDTKETRRLPMRDFPQVAPAGAINSNARDMAQWLRLMLGGGTFEGRRFVSEKNFNELISPQMKIAGSVSYGLGWFLRDWHGHKVAEHGGNIDGFNALVALMPDQKLGFAMLTNISNSALGQLAMEAVWSNLVGDETATTSAALTNATTTPEPAGQIEREVGSYLFSEANLTVEVALRNGKLRLNVPGQPVYTLENVGGRRYRLDGAPSGFFVTFRPVKDNSSETEIYLEQPQGNYVLRKVRSADAVTAPVSSASAEYTGPLKEVLGSYEREKGAIEISVRDGKAVLVVPGQPAYTLVPKEQDTYTLAELPPSYTMLVKRDAAGKVAGIMMRQPNGEFEFKRAAEFSAPLSVDELMRKVVEAMGGEANLRKHKTLLASIEADFEHQGVTGQGTVYTKAPGAAAQEITFMALGKQIGTFHEYFDGSAGGVEASFLPWKPVTGKALEDARINSDFYAPLNWKTQFKSVVIRKMSKVGDEDVYVVVKTPEKGSPVTDYISARSFLLLQRDSFETSGTISQPVTEKYSDYRPVDGVMIPFTRISNSPTNGDTVVRLREAKFDVPVPDAAFHRRSAAK